ncbi:MAG: hypothetical protein JW958_06030 [Candidatus Eisenbacteria bacterium]|nr:hypothetical protein [Candidatus Eisenbacteria bacterium]
MRRAAAAAALLALLAAAAAAEPVMETAVDRDSITVGDPIALLIRLTTGPGEEASLPVFPEERIGPFEILDGPVVEETETGRGGRVRTARYRITAYETGESEIPGLAPPEGGRESRPIPIAVLSVGLDPTGRPRDVKGPKPIERDFLRMVFAAVVALLLLAAAAYILHRRRNRPSETAPVLGAVDLRPAHRIALERLDGLRRALESGGAEARPFHFELSDAVRRYLSDRYALPAPERTSREILREIRREKLEPEATALLRECLASCDLVKFRGIEPTREESGRSLDRARAFVEKTGETAPDERGGGR